MCSGMSVYRGDSETVCLCVHGCEHECVCVCVRVCVCGALLRCRLGVYVCVRVCVCVYKLSIPCAWKLHLRSQYLLISAAHISSWRHSLMACVCVCLCGWVCVCVGGMNVRTL